jgi:hypothetical protein
VSTPIQDPARIARRRHEHERQVVIFGLLGLLLVLGMLYSVAVFTGAIDARWDRPFSGAPEAAADVGPAPCLPDNPGLPFGQPPLPYDQVQIRILNASGLQGIAGAFNEVFSERGFDVDSVGDHDQVIPANQIRFGRDGILAAYTLASQFEHVDMVLDDRPGPVLDFLAGQQYARPIPVADLNISADTAMHSAPGCQDVSTMTPVPGPTDLVWPPPAPEEPEDEEA